MTIMKNIANIIFFFFIYFTKYCQLELSFTLVGRISGGTAAITHFNKVYCHRASSDARCSIIPASPQESVLIFYLAAQSS